MWTSFVEDLHMQLFLLGQWIFDFKRVHNSLFHIARLKLHDINCYHGKSPSVGRNNLGPKHTPCTYVEHILQKKRNAGFGIQYSAAKIHKLLAEDIRWFFMNILSKQFCNMRFLWKENRKFIIDPIKRTLETTCNRNNLFIVIKE